MAPHPRPTPPPIVPRPRSLRLTGGDLDVSQGVRVVATDLVGGVADTVAEQLRRHAAEGPVPVELELTTNSAALGMARGEPAWRVRQAHRIVVSRDGVRLVAGAPGALVTACASLCQVLEEGGDSVPCLDLADAPRFEWRGLSVDVARRFFPVADIVTVLDIMADLRLNVLHLHLTDDQGWRIEVPALPALTELSSASGCGGGPGGHYTEADFARITAEARKHGITVVPEVDVPGHVNAALHAIPFLNPDGVAPPVHTGMEVGFSRLHTAARETEPFLRDVLTHVAERAEGGWVHIGGDEPPAMPAAEYGALVRRAAAHVVGAGRRVVAWQEAATAGLPPGSVLQWWDERAPVDDVVAAVRAGARLLLSPASAAYLDMKYAADFPLGQAWAGTTELRDTHDWDVVVPPVAEQDVIGIEACVFSETLRTREDLTTMLLPRLAAVAEVAWVGEEDRDWDDFARRVPARGRHWTAAGLAWHRSPGVAWD